MKPTINYIIVEDDTQEARTLQDELLDLGLAPENCRAVVNSEAEARQAILDNETELTLVFLDLSIPSSSKDTRIDNEVGYNLLNWIHSDINQKMGHVIRVIIVSGQYGLRGTPDKATRARYHGTLVGVVNKETLKSDLRQVLSELNIDPILNELIRLEVDVVADYETVMDPDSSVNDKCQAAKRLACRLVTNDGDYRKGRLGACKYGDNLSGAIIELIEYRFNVVEIGPKERPWKERVVRKNNMVPGESWGKFIWRGVMLQHLRSINSYRNRTEHLPDHDYSCEPGGREEWLVPRDVLAYFSRGDDVAEIVRLQVRALLRWYLPWHQHVYLPWAKSLKS